MYEITFSVIAKNFTAKCSVLSIYILLLTSMYEKVIIIDTPSLNGYSYFIPDEIS